MGTTEVVVTHPNREKPEAKATKAIVVFLLLVSAALIAIVLVGGWSEMQGAQIGAVAYVLIYVVAAFFIGTRWARGLLPVSAALAVLFAVVAAVAAPAWFERDQDGFNDPALPSGLLGMLTLLIVPVQLALVVFAMRGFRQEWHVEVEVPREELSVR
mgnify:CR=1 FL=1